jgi:predicted DNA-binding protein
MPVISVKMSPTEARRLAFEAKVTGKSKSAVIRMLLSERIQTTDDLLRAWERGEVPRLRTRRSRRRAAA